MSQVSELGWELDGISMHATLVRPDGPGPFPAAVLVAGSGPTDRDWCSPLLPGSNGSGRLLAGELAAAGIASLRYDKRVSGPDAATNSARLFGALSMQSHLDELAMGVQTLAARDDIVGTRIVGLGNSEGTLHVLHYAISAQSVPFAGIVLIAPPGRPVGELLLAQLAAQAAQIPNGDDLMAMVRAAAERYQAGEAMDPDPRLPEPIRALLSSFESPANLPLARELWVEDATAVLAEVDIPTLVLIGGRDTQVDAEIDGDRLQEAARGKNNVTFAFPPNANHVLKEEHRPPTEVAAAPGSGYNEDGTHLDPDALTTILTWTHAHVAAGSPDAIPPAT